MGRADLSRHRKTSPSDTRPVRFPPNVVWVLPKLTHHPHVRIARAISSIDSASTQRVQVQALKVIGISLRDAHLHDGQNLPQELKCACTLPKSNVVPICTLAVPVLLALLFETPAATAGLTSGSLRALVTCRRAGISGVDEAVEAFIVRITEWGKWDHLSPYGKNELRDTEWFLQAAIDVSALSVVLAEQLSRNWVLDSEDCVLGALQLICVVTELYRTTAISDKAGAGHSESAHIQDIDERISLSVNRSMLEAACDSSMKAAQDIINFLLRLPSAFEAASAAKFMKAVERSTACSLGILKLPMAPRNCSMACSVAYVSGMAFQYALDGSPDEVTHVLQERVLHGLGQFPPFSQLSLLRGVMEAPAAKCVLPCLLFPSDTQEDSETKVNSVFGLLANITTANADLHLRFLAMDALISCLRRRAPKKLSPECRDIVLNLVYERWQEPFPGVSSQIREAIEVLVDVDGDDAHSTAFWLTMARSLLNDNWHTKGIYAPLNVLVKRLGALKLLDAEPNCQLLAMRAAGSDSRLAKPVSDYLTMFWTVLWKECHPVTTRFYDLSNKELVVSLVSENSTSLRERTSEYILPSYFRAVGQNNIEKCANALLSCLETVSQLGSESRIRGTVSILCAARQRGVFMGSFSDDKLCNLLQDALRSDLEDLRSSALDLIVTSRVSTEPISEQEVELIRSYLPIALMPGGSPSDRSHFRQSMRRLMERLAACRHAARDGSGGWWVRERKQKYNGIRTSAFEDLRTGLLHRITAFENDCVQLLLSSAYPGAPFARMTNALEVMLLLLKNLSTDDSLLSVGRQTEACVTGLVACLLDEWERPRRSALQLLTSLEDPMAGFEVSEKIEELQKFALPLLMSPRQKAVDSGASIFRIIFRKFVSKCPGSKAAGSSASYECLEQTVRFCSADHEKLHAVSAVNNSPALAYADSVLDALEACAVSSDEDFMASCKRGLFHGHCLLLRYIIQDLSWKELASPLNFESARNFMRRFLDLYWKCTRIAITGVSFQSFDHMHEDGQGSGTGDVEDPDNIMLNEGKKLVSTACFLSMKEICVSLGILCHEVPLTNVAGLDDESYGILSYEQVASVVELFRYVFTGTRHWGVIDGASEGLQLLCERLLQTSSVRLRALPSQLSASCLASALNGELYVLRRSAGIPALFAAILNAEASRHSRCHESLLLDNVVTDLLQHLQGTNMYTDEAELRASRSQEEESVAHALNLLRAMFLNGNLGTTILKYLEAATMSCIKAFCSASWLIRNSAMMLFSALVRRGIGVCVERRSSAPYCSFEVAAGTSATLEGERRLRGVSAFQFFSRHPKLHPFFLQQLETAVARFKHQAKSDHPALFPTLYLLSSLSPAAVEDPTSSISMSPFRAVLRRCLRWRSNYVRRAAAAACVPLIEDPSHVAEAVREHLFGGVPEEPQEIISESSRMSASLTAIGEPVLSKRCRRSCLIQNHLHGELLAVAAVLKGMRHTMSTVDKQSTIKILAEYLPKRSWIATAGQLNPCSVTRASMLLVLGTSHELARDVKNSPAIASEDIADANALIELCRKVAFQVQDNEEEAYQCGMEVGLSSFRRNSAKLLALVYASSYENGEISLDDTLQALSKLVVSPQREAFQVGIDGIIQLLNHDIMGINSASRLTKRNDSSLTLDGRKCLCQLWETGSQVLSSAEDPELLVKTLRLLTAILAQMIEGMNYFQELDIGLTAGQVRSILQIAQTHAYIDVREQAIILAGKLLSIVELEETSLVLWISLIEDATSCRHPPTTRMAAGTSFENSGFGKHCESAPVGFRAEVTVRGFLAIAHLLDDENAEVRSHVSNIVYHSRKRSGESESFPSDVLPSLMWIYDHLGTRFYQSHALLQHMHDLIDVPDARTPTSKNCRITDLIQMVVRSNSAQEADVLRVRDVTTISNNDKLQPLFRSEDDVSGEEVLVRMQMSAYCFWKIVSRQASNSVSHEKAVQICHNLVNGLYAELLNAASQGTNRIISGSVFTAGGFRSVYRSTLRLLLAIACMQATNPGGRFVVSDTSLLLSARLTKTIEEYEGRIHYALLSVLCAMRNMLSVTTEAEQEMSLRKIFFLLPP